ncbi:hypothetical protein NAI82_11355 [Oxalobacter sp. JAC-2022]|uniref:hypothetical protein n=1 Tax=Oxalobacter aliiformigenes TaxID=2946593 RepID=UPI0022B00E5A|nr:hypothetical protein [Oxalobacter aliiformigenes]MCZ4066021.1 hypothetical protein [Oxalobacter aliiformigenes]
MHSKVPETVFPPAREAICPLDGHNDRKGMKIFPESAQGVDGMGRFSWRCAVLVTVE